MQADAGTYQVTITNRAGSATSAVATLSVNAATKPAITTQPTSATVSPAKSVTLTVQATGSEPKTYQWKKDGAAIAGATDSSFSISNMSAANAGVYTVTISNIAGSVTSDPAAIALGPTLPPTITGLYNQSTSLGGTVSFSPSIDGTPTFTYQWYHDGVAISGATSSYFYLSNVTANDLGDYQLAVTNAAGTTLSDLVSVRLYRGSTLPAFYWTDVQTYGGIAYFLFANPSKIERFDIANNTWLPPISLSSTPSAFLVADAGIYVAFDRTVSRLDFSGGNAVAITNAANTISGLKTDGTHLVVVVSSSYDTTDFISIRLSDMATIQQKSITYGVASQCVFDAGTRMFIGRDRGLSPADIRYLVFNADGTFGASGDSPYHGDFPAAYKIYMMPGGGKVVDDAGIIYKAADLTYVDSLGGSLDGIAFDSNGSSYALRGHRIFGYNANYRETGTAKLNNYADHIVEKDGFIYAFKQPTSISGVIVTQKISVTDIKPTVPVPAVQGDGYAFTPDHVFCDKDGILYLYSKSAGNILRLRGSF